MEYGRLARGQFPEREGRGLAIMGENAIEKCGFDVGDYMTVLANIPGGGISAADFRITGTKKGYGETDRLNGMFLFADLAGVQELLGTPGAVDTIIVHLADGVSAEKKEDDIRSFCERNNLEYKRWDEIAVFYERSREVFAGGIISLVVQVSGGLYHPPTFFNEEAYYTFIQPDALTIVGYFALFMLVSAAASLVIAFRALKYTIADCLRWN